MLYNQTDPFLTTWDDIDNYINFLSNQSGQALMEAYNQNNLERES
jgi:thioredoxin reductase